MERLLPTDYFHVVFTVPDDLLNGIILRNRELFLDLLFRVLSKICGRQPHVEALKGATDCVVRSCQAAPRGSVSRTPS